MLGLIRFLFFVFCIQMVLPSQVFAARQSKNLRCEEVLRGGQVNKKSTQKSTSKKKLQPVAAVAVGDPFENGVLFILSASPSALADKLLAAAKRKNSAPLATNFSKRLPSYLSVIRDYVLQSIKRGSGDTKTKVQQAIGLSISKWNVKRDDLESLRALTYWAAYTDTISAVDKLFEIWSDVEFQALADPEEFRHDIFNVMSGFMSRQVPIREAHFKWLREQFFTPTRDTANLELSAILLRVLTEMRPADFLANWAQFREREKFLEKNFFRVDLIADSMVSINDEILAQIIRDISQLDLESQGHFRDSLSNLEASPTRH